MAVTFRPPLADGFGDRAAQLGPNALGYTALFLWPCSFTATTVRERRMRGEDAARWMLACCKARSGWAATRAWPE